MSGMPPTKDSKSSSSIMSSSINNNDSWFAKGPVASTSRTVASKDHRHLPPLTETGLVEDWEKDVYITCAKCPGVKIPLDQSDDHRFWHGRTNFLFYLGQTLKRPMTSNFGPGSWGKLLKVMAVPHVPIQRKFAKSGCQLVDLSLERFTEEFAELRYIEGQRYTFGQLFISRENQGEFVFQSCVNTSYSNLSNYFQLETRNGDLWVRNVTLLDSKYKDTVEDLLKVGRGGRSCPDETKPLTISVNGELLLPASDDDKPSKLFAWTKLTFGDVVTIATNNGRFCDLVLKKHCPWNEKESLSVSTMGSETDVSQMSQEENESLETSPTFTALQIGEIVHQILSCLSIDEVKECRLVSRIWSEEGINLVRKQSFVKPMDTRTDEPAMQVFNFAHDMSHHHFPVWQIHINSPYLAWNDKEDGTILGACREAKILSDFHWLLSPKFSHNVVNLTLTGFITSAITLKTLQVILEGVSGTLTTLDIQIGEMTDRCTFSPENPVRRMSKQMSKLRSLTLGTFDVQSHSHSIAELNLFKVAILPSLDVIQCLNLPNAMSRTVQAISVVLNEMSFYAQPPRSCTPANFNNLTSITIPFAEEDLLRELQFFPCRQFKRLHLGEVKVTRNPSYAFFGSLLLKQASTLEELEIDYLLLDARTPSLRFPPRMKVLKRLSISFRAQKLLEILPGIIKFRATTNKADYSDCFPSLMELEVIPKGRHLSRWQSFLPILQIFLPSSTSKACTSCTAVHIPFLLQGTYHRVLDDIESLFPKANFPVDIREAREQPYFEEDSDTGHESDDEDEDQDEDQEEEAAMDPANNDA